MAEEAEEAIFLLLPGPKGKKHIPLLLYIPFFVFIVVLEL
jgi:hypothetical protein